MLKDKGIIIGVIATVILIAGGVFLFTKNPSNNDQIIKVSEQILAPENAYKTSGFVNGSYLPATPSAKLTIVEFGDYQCPACGIYHPFIKQMLYDFAGQINFVTRNYPLSQHKNAIPSAQAAEAAGLQGKFWEMDDKLFATQKEWSESEDAKSKFISYAQELGLNVEQFKNDMESPKIKEKIDRDINDGNLAKITQTPTFFFNGQLLGLLPGEYSSFKATVEEQIKKASP